MENREVFVGIDDFKELREGNYYYVDKSLFIKDMLDDGNKVTLITRPRRFGKTLNMSMLKYFLDIREIDSKDIFNGLKIMDEGEKYLKEQNTNPVIFMTFNGMKPDSYEGLIETMKTLVADLYREHEYILKGKLLKAERNRILDYMNRDENTEDLKRAINFLCEMLEKYTKRRVILLIDEYDVPLQHAYLKGYYDNAKDFFSSFFASSFKSNENLRKTVVTGVNRVAKDGIFTGANNFDVYTMLDNDYSEYFGITGKELDKIIEDFGIEEEKEYDTELKDEGYTNIHKVVIVFKGKDVVVREV